MTTTTPLISTQPLPGQYWHWRGEQIYYVCAGEAKAHRPPLLLIHGFGASTDHWRKNISELSQEFQVWAIDLLGFGRAAKPAWNYTAELWRSQLHDFITEVIGQPVVLAGNSLGGYAALCVAAEHPESAAGLILLNSAGPFTDSTHPKEPNLFQKAINQLLTGFLRHPIGNSLLYKFVQRKAFIRNTLKKVYVDETAVTEQLVDEIYRPSCDRGAPQVFGSIFSNQQGEKVDVLLGKMQCPLLMIWGEGDPWIDARNRGAKFREYYPQLQEYYLSAGHCPHDESPTQVNAIVHNWVKEYCRSTLN
ncbi:alpha/beta fold hydrolase [Chamaesiphon sp. VAR_69_metabat_338]|uniref:alpha/beta fold hydrolase n=1 Tax=Chamaesiphon sp. VAR_69_metabat_338 TaxID=2964704 RepID=UPI00286D8C5C|nr:alpha/beta fold hydrolase [Chamaesiphon sp. VAR_69_metabat_338]